MCFTVYFISARGVHKVSVDAFSWVVSTLIACCVTIRCLAPLRIALQVVGGIADCVAICGDCRSAGSVFMLAIFGIGWARLINGTILGVLFRVTLPWIRGAFLRVPFAVGLRDCIIGGASVIPGMVSMGVVSITICSSFLTLCSARGVAVDQGGVRTAFILDWRSLTSRLPLVVAPAMAVASANSSVSARKC